MKGVSFHKGRRDSPHRTARKIGQPETLHMVVRRCLGGPFMLGGPFIRIIYYCRDQNYSGSRKMLPGINFFNIAEFIAGWSLSGMNYRIP